MAVVLTIVLSVISFSVTDIAITSRESEALRAFSAAEAGVERALIATSAQSGTFGSDSFSAQVTGIAEGTQTFNYPADVASGDTASVFFAARDSSGSLSCSVAGKPCFTGSRMNVCWGREGTNPDSAAAPAVEVSVYYSDPIFSVGNFTNLKIARVTADPNAVRRGQNAFAVPVSTSGCVVDGENYAFRQIVDFAALGVPAAVYGNQGGLVLAHVKFFYNSGAAEPVGFDVNFAGSGLLPSQGERIESTGIAGESIRKVEVFRLFADTPAPFESSIFATSSIVK